MRPRPFTPVPGLGATPSGRELARLFRRSEKEVRATQHLVVHKKVKVGGAPPGPGEFGTLRFKAGANYNTATGDIKIPLKSVVKFRDTTKAGGTFLGTGTAGRSKKRKKR